MTERSLITKSEPCYLPDVDACCCTCRWHLRSLSHPLTNGLSTDVPFGTGWACACPFFDAVFPQWTEHGMCEGWSPEREAS